MADQKPLGLSRNTAAALAVVLAPTVIGTLVILFLYNDPYVRFHSVQVLIAGVVIAVVQWFLLLTVILAPVGGLLTIAAFVLWLVLAYKAWQGIEWELPIVGELARKLTKKI